MVDEKTGIDFPFYQSQVQDIFGTPNEGQFAKDYLRICDLSEYANAFDHVVDFEGNPWGHKIYCNYAMIDPLKRAFGLLVNRGLAGELRTYDGCFNIRRSVTGAIQSMHSWGLAVDFNAGANPYGGRPTFSPGFVKCFAESGFEWGGLWTTPDGMHFQIVWVRGRGNSNPLFPAAWVA
jgi:hypothetical protein